MDEVKWEEQKATVRRVEATLRSTLLGASDDDIWMRDYLHDWGEQVDALDLTDVPQNIRGNAPDLDHRLADTAFNFYDPIPVTPPVVRPPAQVSKHQPKSIRDILYDWAIAAIDWWLFNFHAECERFAHFEWPEWCVEQTERDEYIKSVRNFTNVLVLGQNAFKPEARGFVWDIRDLANIRLLDYHAPLSSHFDLDYLAELLDGCADRSMVSQVTSTGADFAADVALQIYLAPHLTTLAPGYALVSKEIKRLAKAGYVEFMNYLGFLPCRFIQQGTRCRKLEPERPRRISDAGGPRGEPLFDSLGVQVIPLNDAIRNIPLSEHPDDKSYQFLNDTERTTGILGSEGLLPPRPTARIRKRLPWEAKPHIPDVLHNIMVLMYAARVFSLDLYVVTDDWKDMFNQFRLAPWELWKVGFAFGHLSDTIGDKTVLGVVLEYTLGYGFANASNLCQRFANGVFDAISKQMHEADRSFFSASVRTDSERQYIAQRRALSALTGREECALFSMDIYTDDGIMIVAGAERTERLLRLWGTFVKRSRARMAIPEKRTLGAGLLWCGVNTIPCLGFAYVPRAKVVRACAELRRIGTRDPALEWADYRSLVGLLEHLLPIVGFTRLQMHELYYVHHVFTNAEPNARVVKHITDGIVDRANEWAARLGTCPGSLADVVFGAGVMAVPPNVVWWYVFGDAARERARSDSGLGGYMHGFGWRAPLLDCDIEGPCKLPITVLEYMVIAVNLIMFSSLIPDHKHNWPVFASDSLGSFLAILDLKSKSKLMQFVSNYIAKMPEVARFKHRLTVAHVYGTGNSFGDAESRGNDELIARLSKQLRVDYHRLPLSKRAQSFITLVRSRARELARKGGNLVRQHERVAPPIQRKRNVRESAKRGVRDQRQRDQQQSQQGTHDRHRPTDSAVRQRPSSPAERGTDAATSASSMGDGPGAGSRALALLPQGRGARRAEPERPRRITELTNADFVVGARDRVFVIVGTDAPAAAMDTWRPAYDAVLAELRQAAHGAVRQRPSSPAERGTNAATSSSSMGDGPGDGHSPVPFQPPPPASPPRRASVPLVDSSPSYQSPVQQPRPAHERMLIMAPVERSPDRSPLPAQPAPARELPRVPPLPAVAQSAPPAGARSRLARRRDMSDFDPTMAPTFMDMRDELLADTSPFRVGRVDEGLLNDVFSTYADSAATRTIGADRSAWKKWKAFCNRHDIQRLWRNCTEANTGQDAVGHRREVYILRAFLIETHRMMVPRRKSSKRARPSSSLNVVAGVRRIHKRAMIEMVSCAHLAMAMRGLNAQFMQEEGSNRALLAHRMEPLNNAEAIAMTSDALQGARLPRWTVDWNSLVGISFKAGLRTARQAGTRKADIASLDVEKQPHEMGRDNLTWYLADGAGDYAHVSELPTVHVLLDNECACLRPAASKADQTAEHFGNQLIYLPVIHDDPNNAALALAALERAHVVRGSARVQSPLLPADDRGAALTCDRIDTIFNALAVAALGEQTASTRSFHGCRIFAACCHRANGEDDETIQALCRWRTAASLKIYARINPRDYAARVRRMSSTVVDSRIAANLPTLDDSALHAEFDSIIGPLENGRDIADTCDVHVDSDDEDDEPAQQGGAAAQPAPQQQKAVARPRAAAAAPPPRKRRAPAVQPASPSKPKRNEQRKLDGMTPIAVRQRNPKQANTVSFSRYERYKHAKTRGEFGALGGTAADFRHDVKKGFIDVDCSRKGQNSSDS